MPPGDATWRVGTITVPSATGDVAVTGLGGTPLAVFFYGTNWLTEDTAVTTTGTGLFRGMAALKYDDPGTILQNSASLVPAGDAHHIANGHCMNQLDTSGGLSFLYTAIFDSFDADGFTVNFDLAASGGYKVVYVALMDVVNCGAYVGANTTLSLGWKAGASLLHGAWGGPDTGFGDRTQEYYGGGAYPGTSGGGSWFGAGHTNFSFPTSTGQQFNVLIQNDAPSTSVAQGGEFIGPSLTTGNVLAYPAGTGLEDFVMTFTNNNGGMVVIWDDEASQTGRVSTPAVSTGGTVTVSGLPFEPGLVIGYTKSNDPGGQGSFDGVHGATGFSVATSDGFQWCAVVDGHGTRGSFQSFQRGFADTVEGTNAHAGTVVLTDDGFVMTTEEDDVSPSDWVWHAFGHPLRRVMWIPQFIRRIRESTGGATPPPPPPGLLLLEDDGRIELEDGSGFLEEE